MVESVSKTVDTDVLVVGSEGGGAEAAIHASKYPVKVTLVTKGRMGKCGATMTAGADFTVDGKSAFEMGFKTDPKDSPEKLMVDIVKEGAYLNNQKLVEVYVRDAPSRIKELVGWGMKVIFAYGRVVLTFGPEVVKALKVGLKECNVEMIEDTMVTDLLTKNGKVVGAVGLSLRTGDLIVFRSKATVLATGGWQMVYPYTAATEELTGDGQAMAYRAGAGLVDAEMVQGIPGLPVWPPAWRFASFLPILSGFAGGYITNSKREHFLSRDFPKLRTKTDPECLATIPTKVPLIYISILTEISEGRGGPHGGVYFSLPNLEKLEEQGKRIIDLLFPNWTFHKADFSKLMERLKEGPIEVVIGANYMCGGIRINENCETNLPGLYAAGECAGGLWGANRFGSALTQVVVQGAVAGKSAAEYALKTHLLGINQGQVKSLQNKLFQILKREDGVKPVELRKRIQKLAYDSVFFIREGTKLREALQKAKEMKDRELAKLYATTKNPICNREWIHAVEAENMLQMLEITAKSALTRTESRILHYRSDYPVTDNNNWLKNVVIRQVAGEMHVTTHALTVSFLTPPKGILPYKEATLPIMESELVH
jgi:succinate dehydrogenase/fumarate reductase flavoprotein subunit